MLVSKEVGEYLGLETGNCFCLILYLDVDFVRELIC